MTLNINSPTPDATTTSKGKVQLAGDLAGTAAAPTIKTSVALGGSPTTTTQSISDNSTKIATTAYVDSVPGKILATKVYAPTPAALTVASTTVTAQDTTNMTLAFTVPANGIVDVDVNFFGSCTQTVNQTQFWTALLNHTGGAIVGNAVQAMTTPGASTSVTIIVAITFHLTGLTPGALQLDFAAGRTNAAGCSAAIYVGNPTSLTVATLQATFAPPFVMRARASL